MAPGCKIHLDEYWCNWGSNWCYPEHAEMMLNSHFFKQDRRWNAEQPSATLHMLDS